MTTLTYEFLRTPQSLKLIVRHVVPETLAELRDYATRYSVDDSALEADAIEAAGGTARYAMLACGGASWEICWKSKDREHYAPRFLLGEDYSVIAVALEHVTRVGRSILRAHGESGGLKPAAWTFADPRAVVAALQRMRGVRVGPLWWRTAANAAQRMTLVEYDASSERVELDGEEP